MDLKIIITSLIPAVITFLGIWLSHKYDFKGIVRKAEIENKDDIYHSWKELSDTQKADNEELRKSIAELKLQMKELQSEFDQFRKDSAAKETGYQLRIEQLETENEELQETVETLTAENTALKERLET